MTGLELLQILHDHLLYGVLGHECFNIGVFSSGPRRENGCGTAGCAVGECTVVWPNEWAWDIKWDPVLRSKLDGQGFCADFPINHAREFFSLTDDETLHLFTAGGQNTERYGGVELRYNATKEEVAHNISEFIKRKQSRTVMS